MPRKSAFTDQQIVAALREVEMGESPRTEVCRRMGVTDTTFARWKKKYGAMQVVEISTGAVLQDLHPTPGVQVAFTKTTRC